MVKVIQPNTPPEWEEMWAKIVRWFGTRGVPIYVAKWFQDTRYGIDRKRGQQKITEAKNAWKTLDVATKYQWSLAAYRAYGYYRSTRLFNADYIYRWQSNLSLPGTPSLFRQLFGLKMSNPGGGFNVYIDRDEKDLTGKVKVGFCYKKDEVTASPTKKFYVKFIGYYLTEGSHHYDLDVFTAPVGDVTWDSQSHNFGVTNREYYHVIIRFTIANYDAIVYLDNIRIRDKNGVVLDERFNVEDYGEWDFDRTIRKFGWFFNPKYDPTYFKHQYLED